MKVLVGVGNDAIKKARCIDFLPLAKMSPLDAKKMRENFERNERL